MNIWDTIYRRRGTLSWHARWLKLVGALKSWVPLFRTILFFVGGFLLPAHFFDVRGRVLTGGLIDGRWVGLAVIFVIGMVVARYGRPSSANQRQGARWRWRSSPIVALKAIGIGAAVGSLALLTQNPTEIEAHILTDDYNLNGEPYRSQFATLYAQQVADFKKAGLPVRHQRPRLEELIAKVPLDGTVSEAHLSLIMLELDAITRTEGRVEQRLQNLRATLKDHRGDRVVVLSSHRYPPDTPEMRTGWPLPSSIRAVWLSANPHAGEVQTEIKESRVLSIWVSNDPLLQPLVRVTAESPAGADCKLEWKLVTTDDRNAPAAVGEKGELEFPDPASTKTDDKAQWGYSKLAKGARFAWQFEIPRFHEPRWLVVDLIAKTAIPNFVSHPWRLPIPMAPNQLTLKADTPEIGTALESILANVKSPPVRIDPTADPAKPGQLIVKLGPLAVTDPQPTRTIEIVVAEADENPLGTLELSPSYLESDLGETSLGPGFNEDWPIFKPPAPGADASIYATVSNSTPTGLPVLYNRDPAHAPGWFTIVVPSTDFRGKMLKNAQIGHARLFFFAASLADRAGAHRQPWSQPYLAAEETSYLPLASGESLKLQSMLVELLRSMVVGTQFSEASITPTNSASPRIAPAIPWAFALGIFLSAPAALYLVLRNRRENTKADH